MGVAVVGLFSQRVGWRSFMERQNTENSRIQKQLEQMTPERREQMLEQQTKYASVVVYFLVTVGTVVTILIVAAVYLGVFNLVFGAQLKFVTSFAIVAYAWVPLLVHGLLGILIIFLKDPATVDLKNLVASNPAAFLSDDSSQWLVKLLTSFDLFVFWIMILMAIGFSAANPKKISFGKALGTIVAVWFFYVVLAVGLTAAFS